MRGWRPVQVAQKENFLRSDKWNRECKQAYQRHVRFVKLKAPPKYCGNKSSSKCHMVWLPKILQYAVEESKKTDKAGGLRYMRVQAL